MTCDLCFRSAVFVVLSVFHIVFRIDAHSGSVPKESASQKESNSKHGFIKLNVSPCSVYLLYKAREELW